MLTKCSIAQKVADEGITVIIANGKKENILPQLLVKGSTEICTRFIPAAKPVSSVKKWIAHSEGFAKGEIHINKGTEEALMASSLSVISWREAATVCCNRFLIDILDSNFFPS